MNGSIQTPLKMVRLHFNFSRTIKVKKCIQQTSVIIIIFKCAFVCLSNAKHTRHMALGFDHLVLCVCMYDDDDAFILRICQIQCKTAVITFHVYALHMIETISSVCPHQNGYGFKHSNCIFIVDCKEHFIHTEPHNVTPNGRRIHIAQ